MKNLNKNLIILILAGVLLFVLFLLFQEKINRHREKQDNVELINALSDSIRTYQNKNGDMVTTIAAIQTSSVDIFMKLNFVEEELLRLQEVVKDYDKKLKAGGSVTNFKTETNVRKTDSTTLASLDSIVKGNKTYYYPTYTSNYKDKWLTYSTQSSKDSTLVHVSMVNEYSVVIGEQKGKPFADIINYNPYSTVQKVRTFQVSTPKPKKFGVGFLIGVGINSEGRLLPTIGAGLTYTPIRF